MSLLTLHTAQNDRPARKWTGRRRPGHNLLKDGQIDSSSLPTHGSLLYPINPSCYDVVMIRHCYSIELLRIKHISITLWFVIPDNYSFLERPFLCTSGFVLVVRIKEVTSAYILYYFIHRCLIQYLCSNAWQKSIIMTKEEQQFMMKQ